MLSTKKQMGTKIEFRCECNGRIYASQRSLDSHKKTDVHWTNMKAKTEKTQLAVIRTCECSGKTYSEHVYKQHLKTEKHRFWALKIEFKKLQEELTRKEIKLGKQKAKIEALEESNLTLLQEMASMRKRKKKHKRRKRKTKSLQSID